MLTPLHRLLAAEPLPRKRISDEAFVQSALHEFRRGARSTSEFQQQPTLTPERALTAGELRALARVGLGPDRKLRSDAERARKETLYVFFRAYQSGLSTKDVATLLGVNPSRIRQRVKERTLIALTDAGEMRFPSIQFEDRHELPGLREVLPALPQDIKPLEAMSWLATPAIDLAADDGRPRSPREYLLSTGDATAVIELARALRRGEAA